MRALRLVLFCLALGLIAGLGWRLRHPELRFPVRLIAMVPSRPPAEARSAPQPKALPDAAEARTLVLSRLADAPDYIPFFDRLRAVFPSDYTSLVDAASAAVAKGGHIPNPDRLLTDAMRQLRQTRGILAAQAEAPQLSGIFTAQSSLLDSLAADNPSLCADFLYGGISPTFMAFAATHREALERLAMASLSAIISGKASHIERTEPTSDDFDAITATLKTKGLSNDEITAVLDGKTFDPPLSDARLCEAGRAYLQTVGDMPEEARTRVYALSAALLARS